jgi:hypothetical protein
MRSGLRSNPPKVGKNYSNNPANNAFFPVKNINKKSKKAQKNKGFR